MPHTARVARTLGANPKAKKLWISERKGLTLRRISNIMLTTKSVTDDLPQLVPNKGFDKQDALPRRCLTLYRREWGFTAEKERRYFLAGFCCASSY
jgi:hypothetical protein